ncbi:rhomboid family intramembrane serine protease [Kitasatospora sp. NPDC004240]
MAALETLDPARIIADARRSFFTMVGVLAVIWLVQLVNWLDDYRLSIEYGLRSQQLDELPTVFTSPLLHASWLHLQSNSGPLFVFGFLAAYRGVKKFLGLTALIVVADGAAVWIFERPEAVTVGASGLVYGYFGYVVLRGLIDRNLIDALIAVVLGASYAYLLLAVVPGQPGVSWLGHLGGLIGGLAGAWIFRERATATARAGAARSGGASAAPAVPGAAAATAGGVPSPRAALLKELDDLGL